MENNNEKFCSHYDYKSEHYAYWKNGEWVYDKNRYADTYISKKRKKCPECGRRVLQRISFCHDGCCVIYLMPKHKKHNWFKKNKNSLMKKKSKEPKRRPVAYFAF